MSLLWPEKVVGGLFPGQCWLMCPGIAETRPLSGPDAPASMLAALAGMLDAQGAQLRKGSKVSLMITDSIGALVALPWHEQLTSPDEVDGYAIACFEKQGITIDDRWVMHAQFRSYGSMGLAYSLPRDWLNELVALLEARGLKLARVLPMSALAYWEVAKPGAQGTAVVLLREPHRISALVYDRAGLQGLDVESIAANAQVSGRRLLQRVTAYFPQVASVLDWSATVEEGAKPPAFIAACLPNAAVTAVNRNAWS